jgi:hypothetical protein
VIKNRDIYILSIIAFVFVMLALILGSSDFERTQQKIKMLVDSSSLHFDAIQKIELQREGKHFVFEKDNGIWQQVSPFTIQMDAASMIALINTVQGVQVLGQLKGEASADLLGVGDDADKITLFDNDQSISIKLGRKTLGGRAYATLDDEKVVLVDQSLHKIAIGMDYRLWRDIRLFPNFAIDGKRIERKIYDDTMVIERSKGRWKMLEPVSTRVDQAMFAEWVGRLAAAKVGSFVIDEPSDYAMFGLEQPSAVFTTTGSSGLLHALLIGGRVSAGSQDRYVSIMNQPVVFKMTWGALSGLFPIPEMFVDATGSGVSSFDVKRIVIRSEGKQTLFSKELGRWVDEFGVQADDEKIEALLTLILDTKPPSVALDKYPRDMEVATITFEGYDLAPLDTVRIALNQDGQWIFENGDNVLRLHPAETGEVLTPFIQ